MTEQDLNKLLEQVNDFEPQFLTCASEIFKAGQSKVDNIDFIAVTVLNRAISLNRGYKLLIENNNMLSAVNLLRLQLDNLIRYNSIFVANERDYIDYIIEGKPINKYKKGNQPFTDNFLAKELDKKFSNSYKLYQHLCDFIHLSERHINKIQSESDNENALFRVTIGDSDNFSIKEKVDYTENLIIISSHLLTLTRNWAKEKELFYK